MANVTIREHVISKTDSFGLEVKKSLNQDFVFVNDKLAGYLTYPTRTFKPIIGWDNAHNPMVVVALEALKGEAFGKITAVDAPEEIELVEESDDDE